MRGNRCFGCVEWRKIGGCERTISVRRRDRVLSGTAIGGQWSNVRSMDRLNGATGEVIDNATLRIKSMTPFKMDRHVGGGGENTV